MSNPSGDLSSPDPHDARRHNNGQRDRRHNRNRSCGFDPDHELNRDADSFVDILHEPAYFELNVASGGGGNSSMVGAVFNFTNCIVGAGAIGLGGAMAATGGLVSCVTIVIVAILVKISLDLLIQLSVMMEATSSNVNRHNISYEDLGSAAFGKTGRWLVLTSKFAYAFGCLVAYTVVIHDNLGPALLHLLYPNDDEENNKYGQSLFYWLLGHNIWCTWVVSVSTILPLCLLRDMTPLASASAISIVSTVSLVAIVIYLWWIDIAAINDDDDHNNNKSNIINNGSVNASDPYLMLTTAEYYLTGNSTTSSSDFYKHWIEIRWVGFLSNMGTFVFTFVCQHTVHLTYGSLKPEIRNLQTWKRVSTASLGAACTLSLTVGVFCYMTFWDKTVSDIFKMYPDSTVIDLAKLLLCVTMLLTFPLPFFTCRELLIVFMFPFNALQQEQQLTESNENGDLEEPLLAALFENEPDSAVVIMDQTTAGPHNATLDTAGDVAEVYTLFASSSSDQLQRSDSVASVGFSLADISVLSTRAIEAVNSILLPGQERQLKLPYHIGLTFKLWFIVTGLAIAAPNLGDVLDLVGCASGTLIAFILPGCFAIRLQGYSHVAAILLVVGCVVGTLGTIYSSKQFVRDTFEFTRVIHKVMAIFYCQTKEVQ